MGGQKIVVTRKLECTDGVVYDCCGPRRTRVVCTPEEMLSYARRGLAENISVVRGASGKEFLRVGKTVPTVKTGKTLAKATGGRVKSVASVKPAPHCSAHHVAKGGEENVMAGPHRRSAHKPVPSGPKPPVVASPVTPAKSSGDKSDDLCRKIWDGIQKHMNTPNSAGVTYFKMKTNDRKNTWAIVFAWEDGFEPDDTGNDARFCGRVAYQPKNSGMQCDLMDWTMPFDENSGEVDDTDTEVSSKDDVKYLVGEWQRIRKEYHLFND